MGLIYHYTSLATLLKIIESQELRATDVRYCNDASETVYGRAEVADGLEVYADEVAKQPATPRGTTGIDADDDRQANDPNYWAETIRGAANSIRYRANSSVLRVLAICFSRKCDELSQWRAYGQQGCAIGFEPETAAIMQAPRNVLDAELVDLRYGPEGVEEVVKAIGDRLSSFGPSGQADEYGRAIYWATVRAIKLTDLLKHDGFQEEAETRLVLSRVEDPSWFEVLLMLQHYVNASGLLVPFIPVKINLSSIKELWVGPGPHQDDNRRALDDLIQAHVYRDTNFRPTLHVSRTPYR